MRHTVQINRAPVLTLWAAIVAERLGHDPEAALTLGKTLAGLNAQSKGRRLGIYEEASPEAKRAKPRPPAARARFVPLLGREVPAMKTPDGLRAVVGDKPVDPASVERYLEQKFGEALDDVRAALEGLARAHPPRELAEVGFALYERFRPGIPEGKRGWGAAGTLDLDLIHKLARRASSEEP